MRQQVAGIVLNVRPNVRRIEFDRLKAILTNCVRHGPDEQNRDGHADFRAYLAGQIAFLGMINPCGGRGCGACMKGSAGRGACGGIVPMRGGWPGPRT